MTVRSDAVTGGSETGPTSEEPLLLNAERLAAFLDRSVRSIWRDHAAGRLPRPVRIGGAVRWRKKEILAWISAGCPDRQAWEQMPTCQHVERSLSLRTNESDVPHRSN
jgi:predicted DNA-binding transcriptional regulator AlpA